jgi:intracellular sulfur oxidation DsrE/DsrF family protein
MKLAQLTKCLSIALIALSTLTLSAQSSTQKAIDLEMVNDLNKTPNMALGLQKERHIKGAFKFFDRLLESEVNFENFEIVIWGGVVAELKQGTDLSRLIDTNQHPKLRISVCKQAMKRLKVTEKDLPASVIPVENAFSRLLQIQAKGYNVIIP